MTSRTGPRRAPGDHLRAGGEWRAIGAIERTRATFSSYQRKTDPIPTSRRARVHGCDRIPVCMRMHGSRSSDCYRRIRRTVRVVELGYVGTERAAQEYWLSPILKSSCRSAQHVLVSRRSN